MAIVVPEKRLIVLHEFNAIHRISQEFCGLLLSPIELLIELPELPFLILLDLSMYYRTSVTRPPYLLRPDLPYLQCPHSPWYQRGKPLYLLQEPRTSYYLTSSGSFTLETQPGRWGYRYSDDMPVIFVVSPTQNPSFKHLKH